MKYKNERYQIIDLNNNVLVDDIVTSYKDRCVMNPLNGEGVLISFDYKHYFNLASKELIYKKIDDNINFKRVLFDIKNFSGYKIDMWHKICFDGELIDDSVVIYREHDLTELDPEVKDLVNVINKLPCVSTHSSCSGHGIKQLRVAIRVNAFWILEVLANIVYEHFNKDFYITTIPDYEQGGIGCGFTFHLATYEIGEKAYEKAKLLKDKIQEYIEENYYDSNIIEEDVVSLKKTLNNITGIMVDMEKRQGVMDNDKIGLSFYDKDALDDLLEILWNNFTNDFVLKTSKNITYVRKELNGRATCFILEFIMPIKEKRKKIKELNEILQVKIKRWKNQY